MIPYLIYILIFGFNMAKANTDVEDFFPNVKGNLTKVIWAHAVNDKSLLNEALNSDVMMLEADIVLGKIINSTDEEIPIMGHPPANSSDLSLEQFLNTILQFNIKNNTKRKGVKLDFKTIEVFEKSVDIVEKLYPSMNYPVWINADIVAGPRNATNIPVDPKRFLNAAKIFTKSTLSIGWTTRYGPLISTSYSKQNINEMLEIIKTNNINQAITFPVRAGIAAKSLEQMNVLLKNVTNSTLTIWSSAGDPVNIENLRILIKTAGLGKVFIDVPKSLYNKLHLDTI